MIRRIAVRGYKSLKDVELKLKPLTVIIGPNATGKSNLFDALHLLKRIVRSRTLAEAFEAHRGDPIEAFSFGAEGISGLLKRDEAKFTLEVDVELSEWAIRFAEERIRAYSAQGKSNGEARARRPITERYLRYKVSVAITPSRGVLRVVDESLLALKREKNGANRFWSASTIGCGCGWRVRRAPQNTRRTCRMLWRRFLSIRLTTPT
jgi:predicted ATPase